MRIVSRYSGGLGLPGKNGRVRGHTLVRGAWGGGELRAAVRSARGRGPRLRQFGRLHGSERSGEPTGPDVAQRGVGCR